MFGTGPNIRTDGDEKLFINSLRPYQCHAQSSIPRIWQPDATPPLIRRWAWLVFGSMLMKAGAGAAPNQKHPNQAPFMTVQIPDLKEWNDLR